MTDHTAESLEPEASKKLNILDSDTAIQKKGFLPLLPDIPQQCQTKYVFNDESNGLPAPKSSNEKRSAPADAKGHTFLPLLPYRDTNCPQQGSRGPSPESGPPGFAGMLSTQRPSHEQQEHVAEAAGQETNVRLTRSKSVRRYEWPLIINGVYQGNGPLPSCRIEGNGSPIEPRPYAWPLTILHRARSAGDCEQQPGLDDKEAKETSAELGNKVDGAKADDENTDESRTTDGVSAKR